MNYLLKKRTAHPSPDFTSLQLLKMVRQDEWQPALSENACTHMILSDAKFTGFYPSEIGFLKISKIRLNLF